MKHKTIHIILLALTMVLLILPTVQQHTKWFKMKPLKGATVATAQPKLSVKAFMTGEYQRQEEQYLSENIGFREPLTRLYNQMAWSLFRAPQNKTIFVNDDNWIFNDFTMKHYYGQSMYDYRGSNEDMVKKMANDAKMLYLLQNVLKEYGVTFFVCLAPSKDMVCAEHVPQAKGFTRPVGIRAIDYYPPVFDSLGINYLNLSEYYMQIKDTVSYPIYLKSSSHWSTQAAVYIADSLFHYMEALSGLNIRNFSFGEPYLASTRTPDADLEDVMNLLWSIESDMNYYVDVRLDNDTTADQPRWLTIGDSYYWEWQYNLPLSQMFETNHYWYYNNIVHNDPIHGNVTEVDLLRELLSSDIVMLIYSPCNLFDLNRQFLTQSLFCLLYEEGVAENKIKKIVEAIGNTPEWYSSIEENALAKGEDVAKAVEDNARYLLMNAPGNYFEEFNYTVMPSCRNSKIGKILSELNDDEREAYRKRIYENAEWINSIKEKAQASNITFEQAMERDIDWMMKDKH